MRGVRRPRTGKLSFHPPSRHRRDQPSSPTRLSNGQHVRLQVTRQERTVTSGRWETGKGNPELTATGRARASFWGPRLGPQKPGAASRKRGSWSRQDKTPGSRTARRTREVCRASCPGPWRGTDRKPRERTTGRVSAHRAQRPSTKGQECPCPPEGEPPDSLGFGSHQSRLGNALVPADSSEKQDLKRSNCFQAPSVHPQNKAHAPVETEDAPATGAVGQPQRSSQRKGNVTHDAATDRPTAKTRTAKVHVGI